MIIDEQNINNDTGTQENAKSSEVKPENDALIKCQTELNQLKGSFTFLLADFENYKKRVTRDNERLVLNAQSTIILKFLPIIDNLSRFFENAKKNPSQDVKPWLEGFIILDKDLSKILSSLEINEVQVATFDPEIHEAVAQVNVEGKEPGTIIDVLEKGYTYKGILIRPAKVAVSV